MRTIDRHPEPTEYAEWRAASQADVNYGYALIPGELRGRMKAALIAEQHGLCAYTGIRIDGTHSHIEHLIPQSHCQRGQGDVEYHNMVACFPGPEDGYVPFGAVFKADWPSPEEQSLFVSPRSAECERRFSFNLRGEIEVTPEDVAARATVEHLGLDHCRLEGMRREAIAATLERRGRNPPLLALPAARRRLMSLEQTERDGGQLEPFCFALKQALRKHIARLEHIRDSKRKGGR